MACKPIGPKVCTLNHWTQPSAPALLPRLVPSGKLDSLCHCFLEDLSAHSPCPDQKWPSPLLLPNHDSSILQNNKTYPLLSLLQNCPLLLQFYQFLDERAGEEVCRRGCPGLNYQGVPPGGGGKEALSARPHREGRQDLKIVKSLELHWKAEGGL